MGTKTKKAAAKAAKIKESTPIGEAAGKNPKAILVLMKHGLSCAGCPMAAAETIGQGAMAHGMSRKELSLLLKELNEG